MVPAHGIVTKTGHKSLPGGGGGQGEWGYGVVWGRGCLGGVSRCHSIDRLPKLWLLHYYRDDLKRHYNLKQYWLEVDIEDVASYDESLAEKLNKIPTETLPLVSRIETMHIIVYLVQYF